MSEADRTVWCGNLCDKVTEEILYELFLQGGPVERVHIPKDHDGKQRQYGFVTYKYADSVRYALCLFDGTMLFNRRINMNHSNNRESPQSEPPPDNSLNVAKLVQLGQQMIFNNNGFNNSLQPHDPLQNDRRHNKMDTKGHENRLSRRKHPYQKDQNRHSSHHKDVRHKFNQNHDNHYTDNYSRHNYKSGRYGRR